VDVSIVVWVAGSTLLLLGGVDAAGQRSPRLGGGTSHQHKIGRATKTSDANIPQLRSSAHSDNTWRWVDVDVSIVAWVAGSTLSTWRIHQGSTWRIHQGFLCSQQAPLCSTLFTQPCHVQPRVRFPGPIRTIPGDGSTWM
jgi:hypothetical protein